MSTPSPPEVTSVTCLGPAPNATLQFVWKPTGDYDGPFTILVQDSTGKSYGTAAGGPNGGNWTVSPSIPMSPSGAYVAIVQTNDPNVATEKIPILVAQFQTISTQFDGVTVSVNWTDPQGPAPTLARIALRATAARQDFPPIQNNGTGEAVPNPAILPPTENWYAMVAPISGIATGPYTAPSAIVRSLPIISAASATLVTTQVTVSLVTPRLAGYTDTQQFVVGLYADDVAYVAPVTLSSSKQADVTCLINFPMPANTWPLPAGFVYRFGLRQANPTAVGPEGMRQPFPQAPLYVAAISYAIGATDDQIAVDLKPPAGIPLASGTYSALIDSGGNVKASATWNGFTGSIKVTKGTAANCSITAATVIGVARGLVNSDTVPVLSVAPTLSSVVYDGATVTATWLTVTGASGYLLTILSNQQPVASLSFGNTSGAISVPRGDLSVIVAATSDRATGPSSAATQVVIDPPLISQVKFNADSTATVTFQNVPANGTLTYEVLDGDTQVKTETLGAGIATVTVPANLLGPDRDLSLRGRWVITANSVTSTGPWSVKAALLAKPPTDVVVSFDGQTANVSWTGSRSSLVTGYLVTILNAGTVVKGPVATSGNAVSINCSDLPTTGQYTVVVEPKTGPWDGKPAASAALFQTGLYLSAAANASPNIFPSTALAMSSFDINIYLPNLFKVAPTNPLPSGPVFKLAAAQPTDAPFVYILTIPQGTGSAWDFAQQPIRTAVSQAYQALMTWLDTNQATGLGVQLVAQAIGRAMPQTFAETVLYGCGMDVANGVVDIRTGLILKVEFEAYQYQGSTTSTYAKYLNGFVGANVSTYEVGSAFDANGNWALGFDSFLSSISQYMTVPKLVPSSGQLQGSAGGPDLVSDGFRQPYCRIVYPGTFFGQGDIGSPFPYYNVALVAAASLSDLATTTSNLREHRADFGNAAVLYFRGRTMVTVCQRVWINDAPLVVPVGTTVGNLLESLGRRPPLMSLPLKGVRLMRAPGPIVTNSSIAVTGFVIDSSVPVLLDWNPTTLQGPRQWLDLPLMPGDRLTIGGQ
jgi:hypothetical protein